jgi:hypothetical protein
MAEKQRPSSVFPPFGTAFFCSALIPKQRNLDSFSPDTSAERGGLMKTICLLASTF